MTDWTPDKVIYHHPCMDGIVAAWAIWEKFGNAPQYIPANYGQEPPDCTGKRVLIVDFSYKHDVLTRMAEQAKSIVILDHHKSAQEDLAPFAAYLAHPIHANCAAIGDAITHAVKSGRPPVAAVFDMSRSGAHMAWEFAHIRTAPLLVKLVEDRDLWRFKIPESRMFNLYLKSIHALEGGSLAAFPALSTVRARLENEQDRLAIFGTSTALLDMYSGQVRTIASRAYVRPLFGHDVPQVNCPPEFASEVCHALLDANPDAPFVAAWSAGKDATYYSLRSEDHRMDVQALAIEAGGGGHRNAAGYRLDHFPL